MAGAPRSINGLDVQPNKRIVVAGLGRGVAMEEFAFGRYMPDGTPDPSFGIAGIQTVPIPAGGEAGAVAVAPDGAIIGVGGDGTNLVIVRLTYAGIADPGFGVGGVKIIDIPGSTSEFANTVAVLADGSILLGGRQQGGGFVAKLDAAGNPVAGFGANGIASHGFGGAPGENAAALDLDPRPDGSILAAGAVNVTGAGSKLFAARLTASGSLDPSFGSGGLFVSDPTPVDDAAFALEPQDDRILLAGLRNADDVDNTGDTWLLRLTENGALDPTFGDGGQTIASAAPGLDGANGLALQPDGKAIVGGQAVPGAFGFQLLVGRFTADQRCKGKLPTAIGTAGRDTIAGTKGPDVVVSLAGKDKVNTGKGKDVVCAGRGKDKVSAGKGKDKVSGEAGNDIGRGGPGKDTIEGGKGNDKANGGPGRDRLVGGTGNDRLLGGKGKGDRCIGGSGKHDTAKGCERVKRVP